jgi:CRP-like cAMP-binding protein
MSYSVSPLDLLVRKLSTRVHLDDADRNAVLGLPHTSRSYHSTTYLIREGEPPRTNCALVESGFAYRHKLTAAGGRQIVSLHLPGDFIDLQNLFLSISDHNVQALTELDVLEIDRQALRQLTLERPAVGQAMWIDGLVDSSVYREWVVNVGRRDARARIAHVLCEVALRAEVAGIGSKERFELPMTQEQLADVTGLTSVHVNRMLKALEAEGIIKRDKRQVSFSSWGAIKRVADFNALYLHLDQVQPN